MHLHLPLRLLALPAPSVKHARRNENQKLGIDSAARFAAEEVADEAVAAMEAIVAGNLPSEVKASGSWSGGTNTNSRPRVRGPWCTILLSATGQWAYESVVVTTMRLGKVRN